LVATDAGGALEVRVTDHGPGIPWDEQPNVFDQHARGARGRQRREGLGLGLHLVKTLVELHGGAVGLASIPGQGATFWFRLPVVETRVLR
jgi:two-component system OmpR family sensor kinase